METSRTNAGWSPLGDLTNTPLEGPSFSERLDVVPDESKRKVGQRKKRGRDIALATVTDTEHTESSEWLQRGATNSDLTVQQFPDGHPPENENANENDTCASKNTRRRERDRARRAAMSPEQRALINKKRRDQYAVKNSSKKVAKELQFSHDTSVANTTFQTVEYNGIVSMQSINTTHEEQEFTVVNNTLGADGTNDYVHAESTSVVKEQEQLLGAKYQSCKEYLESLQYYLKKAKKAGAESIYCEHTSVMKYIRCILVKYVV
ncbi:unnamed protein product [Urochloa humidicola]